MNDKPYNNEAAQLSGGFYLMNKAYNELGLPKAIVVTVRPVTNL